MIKKMTKDEFITPSEHWQPILVTREIMDKSITRGELLKATSTNNKCKMTNYINVSFNVMKGGQNEKKQ